MISPLAGTRGLGPSVSPCPCPRVRVDRSAVVVAWSQKGEVVGSVTTCSPEKGGTGLTISSTSSSSMLTLRMAAFRSSAWRRRLSAFSKRTARKWGRDGERTSSQGWDLVVELALDGRTECEELSLVALERIGGHSVARFAVEGDEAVMRPRLRVGAQRAGGRARRDGYSER
jgi:hypothetical protein